MKRVFLILFILFLLFPGLVFAQGGLEETLEAKIVESLQEDVIDQAEQQFLYQRLKVLITKGSLSGREVEVEVGDIPLVGQPKYRSGDRVLVQYSRDSEGREHFYITDYIRRGSILALFLIFVILAVVVGGWRGVSSLLGLVVSFLVIFSLILPQIYQGKDPTKIAVLGSLIIIPVTFYLSHGLNRKTTVAIFATAISLGITGFLAKIFVASFRLTGYASEEAGFLQASRPGVVNIRGLVLAGIIIGALGVLDDITVAQAAVVEQLKAANPKFSLRQLFFRAMRVGQDHIASMVNTLVLVYAGAALPLLLLFIDSPRPIIEVINYEIIAEEIVRILVGSIGLISAVPLTTFLAGYFLQGKKK